MLRTFIRIVPLAASLHGMLVPMDAENGARAQGVLLELGAIFQQDSR
jgi:hypothetical protein